MGLIDIARKKMDPRQRKAQAENMQARYFDIYNDLEPGDKRKVQFGQGAIRGGLALGAGAGVVDWMTGEENALNSGEFLANGAAVGAIPVAGGLGAAIGVAAANRSIANNPEANSQYYKNRVDSAKTDLKNRTYPNAEERDYYQQRFADEKNSAQRIAYGDFFTDTEIRNSRETLNRPDLVNPSIYKGSRRALAGTIGAGIGSLAGAVGAGAYMLNDSQSANVPTQEGASITSNIPMKEIQELSALLGANGAY
jgi:hypothetical protein